MKARPVDTARLVLGVVVLARPDAVLRAGERGPRPVDRRVVRVLGARYLLQAAGGCLVHRGWVPGADATVDLLHAASMVGLAWWAPEHRRPALASAAVASGFAAADLWGTRGVRGRRA